jgi:hypothetical protein
VRALLLFSLLVLGNAETKAARVLPIKRFGDPDSNAFGLGVIDHHAEPSSGLQNRIMTAHQLNQSQCTEKSSKSGFHRVYLDDCDRGLPSLQSKMGATSCGRPLPRFSKPILRVRMTRWLGLPERNRNNWYQKAD